MNNKKKKKKHTHTHTYMNKFTKTTINTYKEKNTTLASKHPKKASKLASI